jgi:hypothetical protein
MHRLSATACVCRRRTCARWCSSAGRRGRIGSSRCQSDLVTVLLVVALVGSGGGGGGGFAATARSYRVRGLRTLSVRRQSVVVLCSAVVVVIAAAATAAVVSDAVIGLLLVVADVGCRRCGGVGSASGQLVRSSTNRWFASFVTADVSGRPPSGALRRSVDRELGYKLSDYSQFQATGDQTERQSDGRTDGWTAGSLLGDI